MANMNRALFLTFNRSVLGLFLVLLPGCQTPERRTVSERMDRLQAENSALQAKIKAADAQAAISKASQRQEDLRKIESMSQQIEELQKKVGELNKPARSEEPKELKESKETTETPKPSPAPSPDLAQKMAEVQAEGKRGEEELAKAQAQIEAAQLAA